MPASPADHTSTPPEPPPVARSQRGSDVGAAVASVPGREPALQRTSGTLRLAFKQAASGAVLERLFQEGAACARMPRVARDAPPEAVLINTAGGLTGGDRFETDVCVRPGAHVVVTTQANEKIYRASSGETTVVNRIHAEEGARVEWLPQETIVFDGARLNRTLDVTLGRGAEALLVEGVVFGRTAMGETVNYGRFRDRWRVRRDGVLVFADGARMDGDLREALTRPLALGAWCAFATILWVSPKAELHLDEVRGAMGVGRHDPWAPTDEPPRSEALDGIRLGVSAWDGLLSIRIAARDGAALRRALEHALQPLRQRRPLPTVWRC